jgi:hypothetical protein
MKKTLAWTEDKPAILVGFALQYASLVDSFLESFRNLKRRKIYNYRFKTPDFNEWSKQYQSDGKAIEIMFSTINSIPRCIPSVQNISHDATAGTITINLDDAAPPRPFSQSEFEQLQRDMLIDTIKNIKHQCTNEVRDTTKKAFDHIQANNMEFSFFVQVWFPCLILYQSLPSKLYKDALNGDNEALEKLLRLDRLLLHDSLIAARLDAINAKSTDEYDKLIKSSIGLPKPRITRRRIIDAIAGAISAAAILMGTVLEEPQIRALFDALSNDINGCDDVDILLTPETFYQAIRRSRENWLKLITCLPLQNYFKSCQGTN